MRQKDDMLRGMAESALTGCVELLDNVDWFYQLHPGAPALGWLVYNIITRSSRCSVLGCHVGRRAIHHRRRAADGLTSLGAPGCAVGSADDATPRRRLRVGSRPQARTVGAIAERASS
jgi:hypothetical protein